MSGGMQWVWIYSVDEVDERGRPTKKNFVCDTNQHGGTKTYVKYVAPKGHVYGRCMCNVVN